MSSGDKGSISASKRHIQDINDKKLEELRNKSKREMGEVEEQIPEQVKKLIELIAKGNKKLLHGIKNVVHNKYLLLLNKKNSITFY